MIEILPPAIASEKLDTLTNFMIARQQILLMRRAGKPAPWTDDPILRDNRFCNIYREDDRVTIWIRENIREPFADHPNLWFMLAIARYINWPETLKLLIETPGAWPKDDNFDPQSMTDVLEGLALAKQKVYTGAYMIRAESDPKAPWYSWSKHKYICEVVLGRLWEDQQRLMAALHGTTTLQAAWELLALNKRYVGWGPFMAYEWVTDLRHTRYRRDAEDIYDWANAGPGAIRGLNRLFGRGLNTHPAAEQTCSEMHDLWAAVCQIDTPEFAAAFGPFDEVAQYRQPRFEMRDIEHTLCELDKYSRVKESQGKMRAKYDWQRYAYAQNRRT